MLLDEPLSALDPELRSQLQDQLAQLQRRFRFTAIMVSHDIGEVFKLSQQVYRLERGGILQSGTPSEIFLQRRFGGKINLRAQVLAVRREEVVYIVSLLLGHEIVDVIASNDEAAAIHEGDYVSLSVKAFSPLISK
jgi:molybdate transport system ATP-binding protein